MNENEFTNMILDIIKNNENNIKDDRTVPLLNLLVNNGMAVSELYNELNEE
ncbi:hypothetical protein [Mammaliicoccus sciuri]|uniref:hypothetical protein n=1 Tax=Mammaliicoccus sciuri TaxID=1296 RepID=UPI002B25B332|nr:hypothetical protein [Mammaliicoccus sciuri]WQK75202.1 hypothetical protein P3U33_05590 [Mammaliicoccus sciuri]